MANVYVRSGAGGAATGADWANAYLTLGAALTAKAAGDIFWVSEDHAESTAASVTLTSPGTATSPCFVYCVNHSGTVPPVSADLRTTATVTITGVSSFFKIAASYTFFDGIQFIHSPGAAAQTFGLATGGGASYELVFKNCSIQQLSTNAGAITFGQTAGNRGGRVILDNTTFTFGATNDYISLIETELIWRNTPSAIVGATLPVTLFDGNAAGHVASTVLISGVDLSALTGTILGQNLTSTKYVMDRCKLNAAVTITAAGIIVAGFQQVAQVDAINCDSSGINYTQQRVRFQGSLVQETTIVRSGGASNGTTPLAWKMVTTANSRWLAPLESFPIVVWNDTTGSSVTATIYGIWGGGAVPNNDEIWIEAEYFGSSSNPVGSFVNSTKADNLASGSAVTSDSSSWGGSTTPFKMTATFTPQQKGPVYLVVKAAKVSSTFYIDPRAVLS